MKSLLSRRFVREAYVLAVLIVATGLCGVSADAQSVPSVGVLEDARAVVSELLDQLVVVASEPEVSLTERAAALRDTITQTHELPYIAQFSVGRFWRNFTPEEQHDFVAEFSALSIANYASRFVSISAQSLTVGEVERVAEDRAQIHTAVQRRDGSVVPIDYVLRFRDDHWKIINVVADGVSDLALKRAEYRSVLVDGNVSDLLDYVGTQVADLMME